MDSCRNLGSYWVVAPVRASPRHHAIAEHPKQPTIWFPASSATFKQIQSNLDEAQYARRSRIPIKVGVLDVVPIPLTHVYLDIEEVRIQNAGEGLNDNRSTSTDSGNYTDADNRIVNPMGVEGVFHRNGSIIYGQQQAFREQIRETLKCPRVPHARDVLRASLYPDQSAPLQLCIRVISCEPVAQGAVTDDTSIVLVSSGSQGASLSTGKPWSPQVHRYEPLDNENEDASEDRFISAAEEEHDVDGSSSHDTLRRSENGSLVTPGPVYLVFTDDLTDDVIALKPPQIIIPNSLTPASSQPEYFHSNHGLPQGSAMIGNGNTSLAGSSQPKLFAARELKERIPDRLLHPQPPKNADEEHRVFVAISALIKLGCFSGDWIQVEAAQREPSESSKACSPATSQASEGSRNWRVAKVYGLPEELIAGLQLHSLPSSNRDASQNVPTQSRSSLPLAYVPPLLLANLSTPNYIRLCPLLLGLSSSPSNVKAWDSSPLPAIHSISPPVAKEVTLLKISTPLSTDRSSQSILLLALKTYFEQKRRLVKNGDLVAVSLDVGLRRYLPQAHPDGDEQSDIEELVSASLASDARYIDISRESADLGFAWFKIGDVIPGTSSSEAGIHSGIWGGTVAVDPSTTRMVQAGIVKSKLPNTVAMSLESYRSSKPGAARALGSELETDLNWTTAKSYSSPMRQRLRDLISVAINPHSMRLGLPPLTILLYSGQRGSGKATAITRVCADLGMHVFIIDAYDVVSGNGAGGDVKVEGLLRARSERAISCGPEDCALLIRHVEALTADRLVTALRDIIDGVRVLIASTNDIDNLTPGLRNLFTHELEMVVPDEEERKRLLQDICTEKGVRIGSDVDLNAVSMKTAALVAADLVDLVDRANHAQRLRVESLVQQMNYLNRWPEEITIRDLSLVGGEFIRCVTKSDFDTAVDAARKNFSDSIGAPKIPTVTWEDVGGLAHVKDAVMETIQLPLEHPELFAKGLKKRSGILFYGPPGTGKTLLAKAIATELSLNFFSVKGPELLNMYIGESEANVRRVFQRARDARPCVIFFDELDSVAPKRGNQGDSGGVMDRIVSQLLAELDGMSNDHDNAGGVFVIGATNRPDLLDAALLRPGRFDKLLYLGISDTHEKQMKILEALTRKYVLLLQISFSLQSVHKSTRFDLDRSLSLQRIAERLPLTYTGADLYALCSDAMLKAVSRRISMIEEKIKALPGGPVSTTYYLDHLATDEDSAIIVMEEDFSAAQRELVGSVRLVTGM